jgi:NADPH2:quinone reductase
MILTLSSRMGNYLATPEEGLHYSNILFKYVEQGVLNATVYKEYPFTKEGVQQAHIDLTGGSTTGKLVLKV